MFWAIGSRVVACPFPACFIGIIAVQIPAKVHVDHVKRRILSLKVASPKS